MGLFNIFKDVLGEAPLDCRGQCPVCNYNTNQTQTGVLGQAKKIEYKRCGTYWTKANNGDWVRRN